MHSLRTRTIVGIALAGVWISISEFVRNRYLVHEHWIQHYAGMGLKFPEDPVNGVVWGIWSLLYAVVTGCIAVRFRGFSAFALAWLIGFPMMWLVLGNLGILPYGILPLAVPLSMLETGGAVFIIQRMRR